MNVSTTDMVAMPVWWPNDISIGVLFAFLGVAGAAIMVYLGEWDKLIAKSARILEIEDRIASNRKIANEIKDPGEVETRRKWEDIINRDENRLDTERRFVRNLGIILYLFIGGVIAAILANSMVEAIAFGAGWTSFIGIFGIKKDSEERRKLRDKEDNEELKYIDEILTEKTSDAYYKGYSDAVEEIMEKQNTPVEEIITKIKGGVKNDKRR